MTMRTGLLTRWLWAALIGALVAAPGCEPRTTGPDPGAPSVSVAFADEADAPPPPAILRLVDRVRALGPAAGSAAPELGKSAAALAPDEARILVLDATQWKNEEQLALALERDGDTLYNFTALSVTGDLWDNLVALFKGYTGTTYRYAGEYTLPVFFGAGRGVISVNPGLNMFFAALREGRRTLYLYYSVDFIPDEGETTLILSPLDILQRLLSNIGMWHPSTGWHALSGGTNGEVLALAMNGDLLIAGGSFTVAGSTPANYVAAYDTASRRWYALGSGLPGPAAALQVHMNALYALSNSRPSVATQSAGLYRWEVGGWVQVGPTFAGRGHALASEGTRLYVGGSFPQAGGVALDNVGVWTDTSTVFTPLAGGTNGPVYAMATGIAGAPITYVGGQFTRAGSVPAVTVSNLAVWDTRNWGTVGTAPGGVSGPGSAIRSMLYSGTGLLVGGSFTAAASIPANNVALYNGNLWVPLGFGPGGPVRALASDAVSIYAGGLFERADGFVVNNIALWNGSGWLPLDGGVDGPVNAILNSGSGVFVGGSFRYTRSLR